MSLSPCAELWADEVEVLRSCFESELAADAQAGARSGELCATLRGLGPHTAGGAEDAWVRCDVRFSVRLGEAGEVAEEGAFAGADVSAEVVSARGVDGARAAQMLAEARRVALEEDCAEPPGVCLAVAAGFVEQLTAANEEAPASGDCAVCLCPLAEVDDDHGGGAGGSAGLGTLSVVKVSACLHRCHRSCLERWWRTAADEALADAVSRREPSHAARRPRCPMCQCEAADADVKEVLGVDFLCEIGVSRRTGAGAKTPEEAAAAAAEAAARRAAEEEAAESGEVRASRARDWRAGDSDSGVVTDVFVHGEPLVERKSTFQAHVAVVKSVSEVEPAMAGLYERPGIRRATHNMLAYRIRMINGTMACDCDDDGESAAGSRLAHLLQLCQCENVLVVVSRWFGGVLLGPSRFKVRFLQ